MVAPRQVKLTSTLSLPIGTDQKIRAPDMDHLVFAVYIHFSPFAYRPKQALYIQETYKLF